MASSITRPPYRSSLQAYLRDVKALLVGTVHYTQMEKKHDIGSIYSRRIAVLAQWPNGSMARWLDASTQPWAVAALQVFSEALLFHRCWRINYAWTRSAERGMATVSPSLHERFEKHSSSPNCSIPDTVRTTRSMFITSLSSMILQLLVCASLTLSIDKRVQSAHGLIRRLEYRHCTADQSQELQQTLPLIRDLAFLAYFALESGEGPDVHEIFVRYFHRDTPEDRQWVRDYLRAAELEASLVQTREDEPAPDFPPVAVRCVPQNELSERRCYYNRHAFVEDQDPLQAQYIVLVSIFLLGNTHSEKRKVRQQQQQQHAHLLRLLSARHSRLSIFTAMVTKRTRHPSYSECS